MAGPKHRMQLITHTRSGHKTEKIYKLEGFSCSQLVANLVLKGRDSVWLAHHNKGRKHAHDVVSCSHMYGPCSQPILTATTCHVTCDM